jgi:hypothetical protein
VIPSTMSPRFEGGVSGCMAIRKKPALGPGQFFGQWN